MSGYEATLLAGRYRVIRRLGAGGTAVVFLACDERLGRNVAIKRLHGAEVTAETAQRLQREARFMASLRHANLVTVYDMVTVEDDLLLTMEYVPGETLAELLAGAPPEWERTREVLAPVAAALDYIHANDVIHRDVKPSNVLIGTSGLVKLTDLGLATAAEITRITPPGSILGTPAYIAPEQARASTCTGAVDIYALATIAFQALSGVLPRAGSTVIAVLAQATREPPPDLRTHCPGAPEAAARALMRGLSAEPESRQATASQLLEEIDAAYERQRARAEPRRERRRARAAEAPPPRRERPPADAARGLGARHNLRARVLALVTLTVVVAAVVA